MYTSTLYRKRSSYGSGSDLWRGPLENDSPDATEGSRNDLLSLPYCSPDILILVNVSAWVIG